MGSRTTPLRWPFWVIATLCGALHLGFCAWFTLSAWGLRGEAKPLWFEVAFWVAAPGLFVPVAGSLGVGAAVGWAVSITSKSLGFPRA